MMTGSCFQLTVQDLPEVPTSVSEDINEKLDLPEVPIQAPGEKVVEASSKRKGICFSLPPMSSYPQK